MTNTTQYKATSNHKTGGQERRLMKNHKSNIKYGVLGGIAAVTASGLMGISQVSAWGPERPLFTMEEPATYPVFNSITNNGTIGDEREFVRIGEINPTETNMGSQVEIIPGKQYLVYIYFHNNASATFNDEAHDFSGVATGVRMASGFSTVITPSSPGKVVGMITGHNTNPTSVWDEVEMTTTYDKVLMRYVRGSAKIYNDYATNDTVLPISLFTQEGTLIGLNKLNGIIPGCEQYHGTVTYVLQAEELGGSIDKTVSKDGNEFRESATIAPGEQATYQLTIANTGDVALTNATVKDTLPEGLALVPGSVKFRANESTTWDSLPDDGIFGSGYNIGTIGTGNTVYITYQVTAEGEFDCNGTTVTNNATLTYDDETTAGITKQDSTDIIIKKADCAEEVIPLDDCENNPGAAECQTCETNPELPECQPTCATNPEMEGCQELPNTGPMQITLAAIIAVGIISGGYYFYRTKKTLKTVENAAKGENSQPMSSDNQEEQNNNSNDPNVES